MNMDKIVKQLGKISTFLGGAVTHHYVSKMLDVPENSAEELANKARDEQLNRIANDVKHMKDDISNLLNKGNTVSANPNLSEESTNKMISDITPDVEEAYKIVEKLQTLSETFQSKEIPFSKNLREQVVENVNKLSEGTTNILKLIEEYKKGKGGNNLIPGLDNLYSYLDSLTLLQESSLLHIIVFSNLIFIVLHILSIFFGNELISYLDLEGRYPKLAAFIKLRAKFQRYYLMWNIFFMLFICLAMICVNLLSFSIR